jgi:virginiamycin A acetyltransferase
MNRLSAQPGVECYVEAGVQAVGQVQVGRFTYICGPSLIMGYSPIKIGDFCSIAANFHCVTHEQHPTQFATTFPLSDVLGVPTTHGGVIGLDSRKNVTQPMPVTIGNDVWIGDSVTVFGGVTVGHGCVIGAKSLVTKDCVPYGVYVGTPARLVRMRFPDEIVQQLLSLQWWTWSVEKIRENAPFFETDFRAFKGEISSLIREAKPLLRAV